MIGPLLTVHRLDVVEALLGRKDFAEGSPEHLARLCTLADNVVRARRKKRISDALGVRVLLREMADPDIAGVGLERVAVIGALLPNRAGVRIWTLAAENEHPPAT
jgi:hypothetical protein